MHGGGVVDVSGQLGVGGYPERGHNKEGRVLQWVGMAATRYIQAKVEEVVRSCTP
jgi:hypothetical protein